MEIPQQMKIQTFTVVVGTTACNARCKYCVSKLTPSVGMEEKPKFNWRNLKIACRVAKDCGVSTALITGKGEPCLFPTDLLMVTSELSKHFGFVELQTNGANLMQLEKSQGIVKSLYDNGLTTVCLSVAHCDPVISNEIVCPSDSKFNFWDTADFLHGIGFSVRINCTLTRYFFGPLSHVLVLIEMAKEHQVEQLTVRNVAKPDQCEDKEVEQWIDENASPYSDLSELAVFLESQGAKLVLELPHGAKVFDFQGQNIAVNNCLTESTDPEEIRQLIYFPDGKLRYSWTRPGAILM
jgi:molybdenum cofactor biosynthesis enzyme MoaA